MTSRDLHFCLLRGSCETGVTHTEKHWGSRIDLYCVPVKVVEVTSQKFSWVVARSHQFLNQSGDVNLCIGVHIFL